jgi:GTP cyclohydrolase II
MKLKLAKNKDTQEIKEVSIDEIEEQVKQDRMGAILYFDQENSHKDLVEMVEVFEDKGYSVYLKEIRFGLDENNYMYEVHIL